MASMNVTQRFVLLKGFNWRVLLIRFVVNALALLVTVGLVPYVSFVDWRFGSVALLALGLGILNALVKPILQFLTLNFIFVTYGFIVIFINTLLLYLLALLSRGRFAVESVFWAIVAATLLGVLSSVLENLLGATLPIIPEEYSDLRKQLQKQVPTTAQFVETLAETPTTLAPADAVAGSPPAPHPAPATVSDVTADSAILATTETPAPDGTTGG